MTRTVGQRLITALWNLWFVSVLLEAPGLHACGLHASGAGHSSHPAAAQTAQHHHGATETPAPAPEQPACTCLGHCCGVSPVGVAHGPVPIVAAIAHAGERAVTWPETVRHTSRPHERPFANGPPVA